MKRAMCVVGEASMGASMETNASSILAELPHAARENILARARGKTLALPEADDARVREAAGILAKDFGVRVHLPSASELASDVSRANVRTAIETQAAVRKKDPAKIISHALLSDPFYACGALLAQGQVDAIVGGAVATTAHVIRTALHTVGLAPGVSLVSSAFLMALGTPTAGGESVLVYSDGAVNPQPTALQLSDIAALAAAAFSAWTGCEARVAFLSFSTAGSASHPDVDKVRGAYELFRERSPDVCADGELQFDAATVPAIATRKKPGSPVAGRANVLVFPTLDAGNIGYKMTQRLAGAGAFGPVLLGVARPFSDLSRGASPYDVVATGLLTLALAG